VLDGFEYLTVFDGLTGKALGHHRLPAAAGRVADWGDNYGKPRRSLPGVRCLPRRRAAECGLLPRLLHAHGAVAWDWRDGKLTQRWTFDRPRRHPRQPGLRRAGRPQPLGRRRGRRRQGRHHLRGDVRRQRRQGTVFHRPRPRRRPARLGHGPGPAGAGGVQHPREDEAERRRVVPRRQDRQGAMEQAERRRGPRRGDGHRPAAQGYESWAPARASAACGTARARRCPTGSRGAATSACGGTAPAARAARPHHHQ